MEAYKGRLIVETPKEAVVGHNLFVNNARRQITSWMVGNTVGTPGYIAVGTGTQAVSAGDTELQSEVLRVPMTAAFLKGTYTARFHALFTHLEPPTIPGGTVNTYTEFGIFDTGTIAVANNDMEDWTGATPDSWTYAGSGAGTSSADEYEGGTAALITWGSGNYQLYQNVSGSSSYANDKVRVLGAVKSNTASQVRLFITDGVGTSYSSYHAGDGTYALLNVSRTLDTDLTMMRIGAEIGTAGSATVDWFVLTEIGNLWARSLTTVTKESTHPMKVIWEEQVLNNDEEVDMGYSAFAAERIAVGTVAGSLTSATYQPTGQAAAQQAFLTVESGTVRYWYSGTSPVSGTGHMADDMSNIKLSTLSDITNFKYISAGGTPIIYATYER